MKRHPWHQDDFDYSDCSEASRGSCTEEACCGIPPCARGGTFEQMSSKELGITGELIAASYLEERGYEVIEHGYRCPEGEADLIAYDFETDEVVLVEVKSRRARAGVDLCPEEAVDRAKQDRYRRIASCYLMDRFPVVSIRFDVVSIVFRSGREANITHFFSVFDWEAE